MTPNQLNFPQLGRSVLAADDVDRLVTSYLLKPA
jgi:hypothetical protein